jgi:hypothetical protein
MKELSLLSFVCLLLSACSDPEPDGHVYTVNGLGLTLPSPDLEMTFLPYNSRAEFFHGPITQAYEYATLGLGEALIPLCDEANSIIEDEEAYLKKASNDLLDQGNVPENPDACMNMCSSRMSLEDQRETEREALNNKIAEIDQKISYSKNKKRELESARSERAGALSKKLSSLKKKRDQLISREAETLAEEQISKLSIELGNGTFRRNFYPSSERLEYITVMFRNNSDFAIAKSKWGSLTIKAEAYYKGVKIKDYSLDLPAYSFGNNFTDSLGFDKGYFLDVGEIVPIGNSIYRSVQGLDMNSPSGRLLAQERNWEPNSRGYILPDEMRIATFPESAFVIPDEKGKRDGNKIVYTPTTVNFKDQVATRGLPQDSEIAEISRQINKQSFPEDDQIAALDNAISELRADQNAARDSFNSSQVAQNIKSLIESESQCRAARLAMNEIQAQVDRLGSWKDNLSSCGTKAVDTGAIFSGINSINYAIGSSMKLPEIEEKYAAKARQLIWAKLVSESQYVTKTDINGDFYIDGAVDQSKSLVFAPMMSISGESFWMQPLSSLKGKKNLNHQILGSEDFSEYISDVISYTCKDCSLEDYSSNMTASGLAAPDPNRLATNLSDSALLYAEQLAKFEASEYDQNMSEESTLKAAPPQACEI